MHTPTGASLWIPLLCVPRTSGGDGLLVTASVICFCQSLRRSSLGFDCAPKYQDADSASPMARGSPKTGFILLFCFFTLSPPLPFSIKYSTMERRVNVTIQRYTRAFSSKSSPSLMLPWRASFTAMVFVPHLFPLGDTGVLF